MHPNAHKSEEGELSLSKSTSGDTYLFEINSAVPTKVVPGFELSL